MRKCSCKQASSKFCTHHGLYLVAHPYQTINVHLLKNWRMDPQHLWKWLLVHAFPVRRTFWLWTVPVWGPASPNIPCTPKCTSSLIVPASWNILLANKWIHWKDEVQSYLLDHQANHMINAWRWLWIVFYGPCSFLGVMTDGWLPWKGSIKAKNNPQPSVSPQAPAVIWLMDSIFYKCICPSSWRPVHLLSRVVSYLSKDGSSISYVPASITSITSSWLS